LLPLLATIETPEQMHGARYRDVILRQPVRGRVVFLGDAAHVMSPQLGPGVSMALLDVEALADALAAGSSLSYALRDYTQRRQAQVRVYQAPSRWLTPYVSAGSPRAGWSA
ncbi:MAG: FAD-dependent monooxygenase, partial [Rhodanobacter sp.]